jgi:hypothetical protein
VEAHGNEIWRMMLEPNILPLPLAVVTGNHLAID